jgi:hypothetical protein
VPPLASVPGGIRLRLAHTYGSELNTGFHFFFKAGAAGTQAELQALADAASAAWAGTFQVLFQPTVTLNSVTATDLSSNTGPVAVNTTNHTGQRAAGPMAASACSLVNFKIARRYRGGKPRIYLFPGADTDLATPQTWTSAYAQLVHDQVVSFVGSCLASIHTWDATAFHANVSYFEGIFAGTPPVWVPNQPRPVPVVDAITGVVAATTVGSQRRRLHPG